MIYKAFATVTLIAAPIIVLTVQSFVPQPNQPAVASVAAPSALPPSTMPIVTPAPPAPIVTDPGSNAAFGQPVPDAGKPFLAPGAGLPEAAPTAQPAAVESPLSRPEEERK